MLIPANVADIPWFYLLLQESKPFKTIKFDKKKAFIDLNPESMWLLNSATNHIIGKANMRLGLNHTHFSSFMDFRPHIAILSIGLHYKL